MRDCYVNKYVTAPAAAAAAAVVSVEAAHWLSVYTVLRVPSSQADMALR